MTSRRLDYDTPEFEALWYSPTPLHVIAKKYGVCVPSLVGAAHRRGFLPKGIAEEVAFLQRLLAAFEYYGGKASVDEVQQWFASRYGVRCSRRAMQCRLRKLTHRGEITRLPGRVVRYAAGVEGAT